MAGWNDHTRPHKARWVQGFGPIYRSIQESLVIFSYLPNLMNSFCEIVSRDSFPYDDNQAFSGAIEWIK